MAYIVIATTVMAYTVMAFVVMAYVVMAVGGLGSQTGSPIGGTTCSRQRTNSTRSKATHAANTQCQTLPTANTSYDQHSLMAALAINRRRARRELLWSWPAGLYSYGHAEQSCRAAAITI